MRIIENLKFKIENSNNGYTLIELLAVMIILIAVGTIIASIFVFSLRGGNKSTTVNEIRQSGNYAIAQMSKMITFAKTFDGVSANGDNYTSDCVPSLDGNGNPILPLPMSYLKITSFDGGETVFSCTKDIPNGGYGVLSSSSASLTSFLIPDTMDVDCSFTCSQTNLSSPPTIEIHLSLKKRQPGTTTLLPESQTKIDFDTSVTIRNNP